MRERIILRKLSLTSVAELLTNHDLITVACRQNLALARGQNPVQASLSVEPSLVFEGNAVPVEASCFRLTFELHPIITAKYLQRVAKLC